MPAVAGLLTRRLAGRELAVLAAVTLTLGGALPLVDLALGGEPPWIVDLLQPFQLQALVALLLGAALWLFARHRIPAAITAALAIVALTRLLPLWTRDEPAVAGGARLTLLHLNVNVANQDHDEVVRLVRDSGADLVSIVELSGALADRLGAELPPPWRPLVLRPSRDAFGIGVYARGTVTSTRVRALGTVFPVIETVVPWEGGELVVLATHTLPPFDAVTTGINRAQLAELGEWVAADPRPQVVIGDLNTTPWSTGYQRLTRAAALRTAARGYLPTWPNPLAPLGIPIDHAMIPPRLAALEVTPVPIDGSDHRGLRVVLAPAR